MRYFQRLPFFLPLIALFYCTHVLADYQGMIAIGDLLNVTVFFYLAIPLLLFLIALYKPRFALPMALAEIYFFFFSIIHDIIRNTLSLAGKYVLLIPMMLISIFIAWRHGKGNYPKQIYTYLSLLLLIFIVLDLAKLVTQGNTDSRLGRAIPSAKIEIADSSGKQRPDIFFIIFDGHTNSTVLRNAFSYDNSELDSFLAEKKFYVPKFSTANYNSTAYSLGATLNMAYHRQVPDLVTTRDFFDATRTVDTSSWPRFLLSQGYSIINNSIFNIAGQKTLLLPFTIANKNDILQSGTLSYCLKRDIGWKIGWQKNTARMHREMQLDDSVSIVRFKQTYRNLKTAISLHLQHPLFVYTHFLLPHQPYVFDSLGHRLNIDLSTQQSSHSAYVNQVVYCRKLIHEIVDSLTRNALRPRIIIIEGDHGYQFYADPLPDPAMNASTFPNLFGIYLPDHNYTALPDTISSVNTFRYLANICFSAHLPILKDSTHFMRSN